MACILGPFGPEPRTEGIAVDTMLFSLVTLLSQWLRPRYNARMRLLEAQIRMLRARVDTSRVVPTLKERAELLRLGAAMGHDIDEVMHVVVPATYKKWLRQLREAKGFGQQAGLGRPWRLVGWFCGWPRRISGGAIGASWGNSRNSVSE